MKKITYLSYLMAELFKAAIVDNTYLRKLKSFYDDLLKCKRC